MLEPFRGVPAVYPDMQSFYCRAMEYLAGRGRRRVATLSVSVNPDHIEQMLSLARAHGMTSRPQWVQGCTLENTFAAGQIARLLMAARSDDLPDALVICDDNLVEHACGGLVAAGVRVPEDLSIVTFGGCVWPEGGLGERLTVVTIDEVDLGRRAALLIGQMQDGQRPLDRPQPSTVQFKLAPYDFAILHLTSAQP
jgi:DNA-binding LacI/PurR family transcriptional regulator